MAIIGPFIDSGINPHLLNEYDLEIQKATKNKSIIKVETQQGTYGIKKSTISNGQAERMQEISMYLIKNKFSIPKMISNKYGDYFIPIQGGLFYVTEWIEGKGITLNKYEDLLTAVSTMSELHKIGFSFADEQTSKRYPHLDELHLGKVWQEKIDWLKRYQKKLRKKTSITAFEHIFLTYVPFLHDWASESLENLNQWVIQYTSIEEIRKTISHGKFHHRNLQINRKREMVVLDLEHATLDTPVRDLTYFIRHYILNKEHRQWADHWMKTYQKNVPLFVPEKKLLAILLLFPERILTLAISYEKKDKDWNDDVYLKKLQVRWSQMKELLWFVDQNQWLNE